MKRFRLDLKAAKIEAVDPAGGRVDFHALRMSFQMNLTLSGTTPRVAMELMRHSDMKLTMKTCTDSGLLPTAAAIQNLPSLVNGPDANTPAQKAEYTPLDTPVLGPEGHPVSPHGTAPKNDDRPGMLINRGVRHDMAQNVQPCPKWEMVGATGFEPATSWSQTKRSTKLSYAPIDAGIHSPAILKHKGLRSAVAAGVKARRVRYFAANSFCGGSRLKRFFPLAAFHARSTLSCPPPRIVWPSGVMTAEKMKPLPPA